LYIDLCTSIYSLARNPWSFLTVSAVSTGTIFSVFKKTSPGEPSVNDILKPGTEMVAAGYCMYGSAIDVSAV